MIGQAQRLIELKKLERELSFNGFERKIFASCSGKGGTGKTFITLNLAYALVRKGKKVLLVDLDSNMSNANILINAKPEKTLIEFYKNKASLRDLIYSYEKNYDFIFGDSGRLDYPKIDDYKIDDLFAELRELSKEYDYIFLDLSSGATPEILSILAHADANIIIATPEPTAVMDAYVIIKLLKKEGSSRDKLLIINKSGSMEEASVAFDNLNKASAHFLNEKLTMLGLVHNDSAASKSIIQQELALKKFTSSRISTDIFRVAEKFSEYAHLANNSQRAGQSG
jgi:flagellar biosynthesis protein FlhG